MTTLTQASRQWARRPADERFTSLLDLQVFKRRQADHSRATVASTRDIELLPDAADPSHRALLVNSPTGAAAPTHWSFGQLCSLASPGNSPAAYFRESSLPVPVVADCLNFNLRFTRQAQEIGTLAQRQDDGSIVLRAATGPRYGRIWDAHVVDALVERFGDGISGYWRVPGEFGRRVDVDQANTTLYASESGARGRHAGGPPPAALAPWPSNTRLATREGHQGTHQGLAIRFDRSSPADAGASSGSRRRRPRGSRSLRTVAPGGSRSRPDRPPG